MNRTGIAQYAIGHLRNVGNELCLVPVANEIQAQVTFQECEEDDNQKWTSFTSGEIKHNPTGYCLGNLSGYQGIMSIQPCSDVKEMSFDYITGTDNTLQLGSKALTGYVAQALDFQNGSVAHRVQDTSNLYQFW